MGRVCVFFVMALLATLCHTSSARPAQTLADVRDDTTCSVCLTAVRVMSDLMCDPATTDFLMQVVLDDVCPAFKDQEEQCQQFAVALVPVAIEWLRSSATPATMCAAVGVCPQAALGDPELHRPHFRYVEGANCPLCKFVVRHTLASLEGSVDGSSKEDVLDAAQQACGALPSEFADTCSDMVAGRGGAMSTAVLGGLDTDGVCAASGYCNSGLMALRPSALPAHTLRAWISLHQTQSEQRAEDAGPGALRAGSCDTCKLTVMEMRLLLDNPSIQEDIREYIKTMCSSMFPGEADMCNTYVDLYAPLIFQQLDSVMQPDPVCQGLHMCPPPPGTANPWTALTTAHATSSSSFLSRLFHGMMAKVMGYGHGMQA